MPHNENGPLLADQRQTDVFESFDRRFDNTGKHNSTEIESQSDAVAIVAKRYRLTVPHARVVVELAQIGGHHG